VDSAIAHKVRSDESALQEPTLWAIHAANRLRHGIRAPAIAHMVRSYESAP
jgi:hypothetical protein